MLKKILLAYKALLKRAFQIAFVICIVAILYLATSNFTGNAVLNYSDKLNHAFAFFVLYFLLDIGFSDTISHFYKISLLILFGVLIECIQYFISYRSSSFEDILADIVGIGFYLLFYPLIRKYRTSIKNMEKYSKKTVPPSEEPPQ